jgi:hypothetical protein
VRARIEQAADDLAVIVDSVRSDALTMRPCEYRELSIAIAQKGVSESRCIHETTDHHSGVVYSVRLRVLRTRGIKRGPSTRLQRVGLDETMEPTAIGPECADDIAG